MQAVTEIYLSCIEQKINGIQYTPGQQVPDAGALSTLPALIATRRIRVTQGLINLPDEAPPPSAREEDLGEVTPAPRAPRVTRKKAKKKARRQ